MSTTAYPLQWPEGWKRAKSRQNSRFKPHAFGRVRNDLFAELKRLGAADIVLSTNIPLKLDGMPYAKYANITDVGVAVYFSYKKKQMAFACDAWRTIEENLLSIHKTIEAIRGIERWGASDMIERAFTGFTQLEAPGPFSNWWDVLKVQRNYPIESIKAAYRAEAKAAHPDNGGSHESMLRVNKAYEEATKERS